MKYYNVELFPAAAEKLQQFLYNIAVKFEISAAGPMIHFEILTDPAGAAAIDQLIEKEAIL